MRLSVPEVRRRGQGDAHLALDPTYSRLVMRRISPWLTWLLVNATPLSADAVTALAIVSGIAAAALVLVPGVGTYLLAVLLLQLAYLLDTADGEVARVRGTAGKRGAYLDLIGHFLQNRALYGAAGYVLIVEADYAPWAIAVALLGVGLASPFGEQARLQVLRGASGDAGPHARVTAPPLSSVRSPAGLPFWLYRRVAFLWNYPASMNLFCLALLADAARFAADAEATPLLLPAFGAVFSITLALKQIANALRLLLDRRLWATQT